MSRVLVTAAHRHLMASGIPAALVDQGLLGADDPGKAFADGWVFSGDITGDPYRNVEGTGKAAIVLYSYDDWSPATANHTTRFPRLHLAIYADVTRGGALTPVRHDAEAKADAIFAAVDPLFHDNANRIHAFADLRVISTLQGGGFSLALIPSGDGAVRGDIVYDVTLG